MLSVRECVTEAVKSHVAPMFKAHGFKKSGLTFTRRKGSVVNCFQIQLSSWNQGAYGVFYLNAGVAFDELFAFYGEKPLQTPKLDDCQFMVRLEELSPALLKYGQIVERTNPDQLGAELAPLIETSYVQVLNSVSNLEDFAATGWVNVRPWGFPAKFAYARGYIEEARALIQQEAERFANRGATFESVARSYRLQF